MPRIRWSLFARDLAGALAVTALLSACYKWVPLEPVEASLRAQAYQPASDRDLLRLHLASGETLEGTLDTLVVDSLVLARDERPASIPMKTVEGVDIQEVNGVATGLAVPGGIGLFFVGVMAAAMSSWEW